MGKWADYLIGAVHYNETKNNKKYIAKVLVFDNANGDNSIIGRVLRKLKNITHLLNFVNIVVLEKLCK